MAFVSQTLIAALDYKYNDKKPFSPTNNRERERQEYSAERDMDAYHAHYAFNKTKERKKIKW